jgi:NAD(P)H dehydrogenase (quinone)
MPGEGDLRKQNQNRRNKMKVLVVCAHPIPWSLNHAILGSFTKGLADGGHTFEVVDLYAIKFDPVLTGVELLACVQDDTPEWVLELMKVKEGMIIELRTGKGTHSLSGITQH